MLAFKVTYQVKLLAATGQAGDVDTYRKPVQGAIVIAADMGDGTIKTVMDANVTLAAGETYDILGVQQILGGQTVFQ